MINLLKNILNHKNSKDEEVDSKNLELICGLMIEAAYTDGTIEESELKKIKFSLINVFDENEEEVDLVLDEAIKKLQDTINKFTGGGTSGKKPIILGLIIVVVIWALSVEKKGEFTAN